MLSGQSGQGFLGRDEARSRTANLQGLSAVVIVVENCAFTELRGICDCFWDPGKFTELQEAADLHSWPADTWNPGFCCPLETWLTDSSSEEQRQRLKALGNVVIPPQAEMGASIMSRLFEMHSPQ